MITQKKLYKSLKRMIKWSQQIQERYRATTCLSAMAWSKEFCSVKFCLSRSAGHTTFAKKLLTKFFKNAVYLTVNNMVLSNVKRDFNGIDLCKFGTYDDAIRGKFIGISADAVIIDCASFLSQQEIQAIYECFCSITMRRNFIFLFLE